MLDDEGLQPGLEGSQRARGFGNVATTGQGRQGLGGLDPRNGSAGLDLIEEPFVDELSQARGGAGGALEATLLEHGVVGKDLQEGDVGGVESLAVKKHPRPFTALAQPKTSTRGVFGVGWEHQPQGV